MWKPNESTLIQYNLIHWKGFSYITNAQHFFKKMYLLIFNNLAWICLLFVITTLIHCHKRTSFYTHALYSLEIWEDENGYKQGDDGQRVTQHCQIIHSERDLWREEKKKERMCLFTAFCICTCPSESSGVCASPAAASVIDFDFHYWLVALWSV